MTNNALDAACLLESQGIQPTIVHARYVKPLDTGMLTHLTKKHKLIITIEENSIIGGFGEQVMNFYVIRNGPVKIHTMAIPDRFVEQGTREILLHNLRLDAEGIAEQISQLVRNNK
jgi:1-deoxy-D-xylulose-5-phosphate synthase